MTTDQASFMIEGSFHGFTDMPLSFHLKNATQPFVVTSSVKHLHRVK